MHQAPPATKKKRNKKMHLYHLSLQKASTCLQAAVGNFSATPRSQEIVILHGSSIELFGIDANAGKLVRLAGFDLMATVRRISALRLPGNLHDHLLVSDDGGCISLLEYRTDDASWMRLQCETFGKTGLRRLVPGEFLVADPKGRACMIGKLGFK
jgi:splicing factor 3B subunit 3